jgi:hypothetical protein
MLPVDRRIRFHTLSSKRPLVSHKNRKLKENLHATTTLNILQPVPNLTEQKLLIFRTSITTCVISGFHREVYENCALLDPYAASSGNFIFDPPECGTDK